MAATNDLTKRLAILRSHLKPAELVEANLLQEFTLSRVAYEKRAARFVREKKGWSTAGKFEMSETGLHKSKRARLCVLLDSTLGTADKAVKSENFPLKLKLAGTPFAAASDFAEIERERVGKGAPPEGWWNSQDKENIPQSLPPNTRIETGEKSARRGLGIQLLNSSQKSKWSPLNDKSQTTGNGFQSETCSGDFLRMSGIADSSKCLVSNHVAAETGSKGRAATPAEDMSTSVLDMHGNVSKEPEVQTGVIEDTYHSAEQTAACSVASPKKAPDSPSKASTGRRRVQPKATPLSSPKSASKPKIEPRMTRSRARMQEKQSSKPDLPNSSRPVRQSKPKKASAASKKTAKSIYPDVQKDEITTKQLKMENSPSTDALKPVADERPVVVLTGKLGPLSSIQGDLKGKTSIQISSAKKSLPPLTLFPCETKGTLQTENLNVSVHAHTKTTPISEWPFGINNVTCHFEVGQLEHSMAEADGLEVSVATSGKLKHSVAKADKLEYSVDKAHKFESHNRKSSGDVVSTKARISQTSSPEFPNHFAEMQNNNQLSVGTKTMEMPIDQSREAGRQEEPFASIDKNVSRQKSVPKGASLSNSGAGVEISVAEWFQASSGRQDCGEDQLITKEDPLSNLNSEADEHISDSGSLGVSPHISQAEEMDEAIHMQVEGEYITEKQSVGCKRKACVSGDNNVFQTTASQTLQVNEADALRKFEKDKDSLKESPIHYNLYGGERFVEAEEPQDEKLEKEKEKVDPDFTFQMSRTPDKSNRNSEQLCAFAVAREFSHNVELFAILEEETAQNTLIVEENFEKQETKCESLIGNYSENLQEAVNVSEAELVVSTEVVLQWQESSADVNDPKGELENPAKVSLVEVESLDDLKFRTVEPVNHHLMTAVLISAPSPCPMSRKMASPSESLLREGNNDNNEGQLERTESMAVGQVKLTAETFKSATFDVVEVNSPEMNGISESLINIQGGCIEDTVNDINSYILNSAQVEEGNGVHAAAVPAESGLTRGKLERRNTPNGLLLSPQSPRNSAKLNLVGDCNRSLSQGISNVSENKQRIVSPSRLSVVRGVAAVFGYLRSLSGKKTTEKAVVEQQHSPMSHEWKLGMGLHFGKKAETSMRKKNCLEDPREEEFDGQGDEEVTLSQGFKLFESTVIPVTSERDTRNDGTEMEAERMETSNQVILKRKSENFNFHSGDNFIVGEEKNDRVDIQEKQAISEQNIATQSIIVSEDKLTNDQKIEGNDASKEDDAYSSGSFVSARSEGIDEADELANVDSGSPGHNQNENMTVNDHFLSDMSNYGNDPFESDATLELKLEHGGEGLKTVEEDNLEFAEDGSQEAESLTNNRVNEPLCNEKDNVQKAPLSNICASMTSFTTLLKKASAPAPPAAGKKGAKVPALEAAEAARREEDRKAEDRRQRRIALAKAREEREREKEQEKERELERVKERERERRNEQVERQNQKGVQTGHNFGNELGSGPSLIENEETRADIVGRISSQSHPDSPKEGKPVTGVIRQKRVVDSKLKTKKLEEERRKKEEERKRKEEELAGRKRQREETEKKEREEKRRRAEEVVKAKRDEADRLAERQRVELEEKEKKRKAMEDAEKERKAQEDELKRQKKLEREREIEKRRREEEEEKATKAAQRELERKRKEEMFQRRKELAEEEKKRNEEEKRARNIGTGTSNNGQGGALGMANVQPWAQGQLLPSQGGTFSGNIVLPGSSQPSGSTNLSTISLTTVPRDPLVRNGVSGPSTALGSGLGMLDSGNATVVGNISTQSFLGKVTTVVGQAPSLVVGPGGWLSKASGNGETQKSETQKLSSDINVSTEETEKKGGGGPGLTAVVVSREPSNSNSLIPSFRSKITSGGVSGEPNQRPLKKVVVVQVPVVVPKGGPENYEISPYRGSCDEDSDDSEEEERRRVKKPMPLWTRKEYLLPHIIAQASIDPDDIFGTVRTCNLDEVFNKGSKKKRAFRKRTSSGNWTEDRLTWKEQMGYKRAMGFL